MGVKFGVEEGATPYLLLTALGVWRMLPALQRLGDAYGF